MCENTLLAMRQIVTAMNEEGPMFLHDMNREERRAFEALFNTCEDFMSLSEELQEQYETAVREGTLSQFEEDTE
jgi:hypothetical protein